MVKNFFWEWREWNFRTALDNLLLCWVYEFVGAKSMRVSYHKNTHRPYNLEKLEDAK